MWLGTTAISSLTVGSPTWMCHRVINSLLKFRKNSAVPPFATHNFQQSLRCMSWLSMASFQLHSYHLGVSLCLGFALVRTAFCHRIWAHPTPVQPHSDLITSTRNFFFNKDLFYLFESTTEGERHTQQSWVTLNDCNNQGWLGQNQEPETPSRSPMCVAEAKALRTSSTQVH